MTIRTLREKRWQDWRRARALRASMVRAESTSRPSFPWRGERRHVAEWLIVAFGILNVAVTVAVFLVADGREPSGVVTTHRSLAWTVLGLGIVGFIVLLVDVASYRPRLFVACAGDADEFFVELGELSGDLNIVLADIRDQPATRWAHVKEKQEGLLLQTREYFFLDGLRVRIAGRLLLRMAGVVVALGLIGYALSTLASNGFIQNMPSGAGLKDHLIFTVVLFFTAGFGEFGSAHGDVGYAFTALTLFSTATIVYFFVAEIIASQVEFRTNMRAAAESFVVRASSNL